MKPFNALPLLVLFTAVLGCSTLRDLSGGGSGAVNSAPDNTNAASANAPSQADETGAAVTPSGDPRADIESMADRFLEQRSFRVNMAGTGDTPVTTSMDFVAPDRFRVRMANGMETIIIGKNIYIKMGDHWQKQAMNLDQSVPDMRAAFDREGRKWFSDVKYLGEETAKGKPSLVYQYHNKGPGGVGENDSKIWIAKADGLPVKIESTYRAGNLKSMLIEYDFDVQLSIEPPVE